MLPLGVVIVLLLAILVLFNFGNGIIYTLALSKWKAIIFLLSFAVFYIIPPMYIEGVDFYIVPFFAFTGYLAYLLFRLAFPLKSVFTGIISAFIIYMLSKTVLPQPVGLIYEPFIVYALALTVICVLLCYGKRAIVFNSGFAVLLFNTFSVIKGEYNMLFSADAFGCICLSAVLSYYPVSIMAQNRIAGFKRSRVFQTEASESLLITKNKIKKQKKK